MTKRKVQKMKHTTNTERTTHTFEELKEIMKTLRSEQGCLWDRAQTNESLIPFLEEETQEVIEAIHKEDTKNLCEELGDLLYQIMLLSEIAEEKEQFNIDDVISGISSKMIRRHPNVFGSVQVNTWEEGEELWKALKIREKE